MFVSILLACHNRSRLTERILNQILKYNSGFFEIGIVVVDDGSTDGTGEMLSSFAQALPGHIQMKLIEGDGNLYWSKSMSLAQQHKFEQSDAVLWLNDDVNLYHDAFSNLEQQVRTRPGVVLVGQCWDPLGEKASFGGFINQSSNPLKLTRKVATISPIEVSTFCGNFVLIPREVIETVGDIDSDFEHALGDIDYGYRIYKNGFKIECFPKFIGECTEDSTKHIKGRISAIKYWSSTKKSPIKSQIRFLKRHGGRMWFIWLISPYIRLFLFGARGLSK